MSMAVIKPTGRRALCITCGLDIYEGTAWGDPQWWHVSAPQHAIEPEPGTIEQSLPLEGKQHRQVP